MAHQKITDFVSASAAIRNEIAELKVDIAGIAESNFYCADRANGELMGLERALHIIWVFNNK